ncbi:MAG: dihydropteroate synthase [Promicromonosporaceae bacterium]|nr:dihydropteroate synthase [Promicromonosporaceae bacterium]
MNRCLVMGILNVTPDSFSDGGRFTSVPGAIRHGLHLLDDGADLIDVGGESTRPGAIRISEAEELRRVLPVIVELVAAGAIVSVDTMRASVAAEALAAGARIVNDVSGGQADPGMRRVIVESGAVFIAGHWRKGVPVVGSTMPVETTDQRARRVIVELAALRDGLIAAGIARDKIVLDPGIGFGKTAAENWALLARLPELNQLGQPVLIGTSRKRFLGELLAIDGAPPPPHARDIATAATSVLAAYHGAWAVRVHDVRASRDAIAVATAWRRVNICETSSTASTNTVLS